MSLQIWLPLNGSTINQGVAGFQPTAADIVYTSSGKIGAQACAGGTVSITAAQTASIFNNNEITIAFWIKPLSATTGGIIFGNDSMATNNNRKFSLFQYHNSQTHPNMVGTSLHWSWMNDAAEQTFTSGIIENCLPVNVWTHVCVTYKNPNVKIYINGGEVKTVSSVISNSSSFTYNTTILNSNSNRYINDLRVYDHALSALEVKQLSQGLAIHYTFDDELLTSYPTLLQNEAGLVQPSGVNNVSLSTNSRIGKYSGQFNGSTSYIDTPMIKPNMFTDDYTLNFWVYHNEGDGRAVYFGDYETTNKMQLNIERTADKKLRYYHAANPDHNFDLTIPDKQWTMVTLKYVKSETKLYAYLNGDIDNKQSLSHTPTLTKTSGIVKIGMDGRTNPGVTPLNGYIDDFRFYCSALSDNDIQDLYNCGASLSDLGDAHANNFIENATYHGVDEYHNIQANEIYEDILGKDYQQLEYLEATGTQYINTGFTPNNNTHIQITYKSKTGELKALFGARTASNQNVFTAWVQDGKIYTHYGNRDYNAISPISGDTYQKFIYNQNKNIGTVLFNNNTEGSIASSEALFNSGCNLTLLAVNSNGTVDERRSIGYLYSCQLYDNGTLIRNYYPARRISDGVLGLYDVIQNRFYINAGSGSFVAGPTVTVNETSAFTENKNFTSRQIIEI